MDYDIESEVHIYDNRGEKLSIVSDPDSLGLVMIKGNDYFGGEIQFDKGMIDAVIQGLQKFKSANDL